MINVWILDAGSTAQAANTVAQSPFSDLWHTVLVAVAVWIGNFIHKLTSGSDN